MNRKWIASGALALSFLCSCRSNAPRENSPAVAGVREVSASQLKSWMAASEPFTLIDVREDKEWREGHASSALHIPRLTLSDRIGAIAPDKAARIVLYCRSGRRSALSAGTLQRLGYTNVFSLAGGLKDYVQAGLPIQR